MVNRSSSSKLVNIVRPVYQILIGTGSAQLLALALMPVITRLYTPEEFGVYGVVLAVVGLAIILSTLQLQHAIVLPASRGTSIQLCRIVCEFSVFGSIGVFLSLLIYSSIFHSQLVGTSHAVIAGLAVLATGVSASFQALAVRERAFSAIGNAALVRVLAIGATQVTLGFLSLGSRGLLLGYLVGEIASFLVYFRVLGNNAVAATRVSLSGRRKRVIRSFGDFATYGTLQEILSSAGQLAPTLLLGTFFGATVVGWYSFAMKIIVAPARLITAATRQVLSRHFAEIAQKGDSLAGDFRHSTYWLLLSGSFVAALVVFYLPAVFSYLFGPNWIGAGEYAQYLLFLVVLMMANVPASIVFKVLRQQRRSLVYYGALFAARVASLVLGARFLTDLETIGLFVAVGVAWNAAFIAGAGAQISRADRCS
jgi:O-antigen/teichoic acid export membrane protein